MQTKFYRQISRVTILAPCDKVAQNGGENVGAFVTGTIKSLCFVTGQIGMKFGKKRQSVPLLNVEEFLKFFLRNGGDFAPKQPFSVCFDGLRVIELQVIDYVFRPSIY